MLVGLVTYVQYAVVGSQFVAAAGMVQESWLVAGWLAARFLADGPPLSALRSLLEGGRDAIACRKCVVRQGRARDRAS